MKRQRYQPRHPLDETAHFDAPVWHGLLVKAHTADPRETDGVADWCLERIRKGNTGELVPLPFEPGTLCQRLETALPGRMGRGEQALQGVTGNAEGLPVVGQQIMEVLGGVVEAVACIQL